MFRLRSRFVKMRMPWLASSLSCGSLVLSFLLVDSRSVSALPIPSNSARALPAFARKYGMPCSSCHEGWPKLTAFGQQFKDNGYQMGNEKDAPIYQNPGYWPVTFRITPNWHRENTNHAGFDGPPPGEASITTHGFDWSGLDFHTAGTLAKNISFYVLPSSDSTGAFHFESVWGRLDNLGGSPWLNIKFGKFELDNLHSEKRILTLSSIGGSYQNYHFQPFGESLYKNGIGDNQVGVEWLGHSKDDRTRISASLLNSNDGQPNFTSNNGANDFGPTGKSYNGFFAASRAFELGELGLQRVGGFAYLGQAPTYFKFFSGGSGISGTGAGYKGFYRAGFIGMWYVKKLDVTTMFFHGWDSAFLGTNTAANSTTGLPTGAQAPTWNGGLIEGHYTFNPQFIWINRYELVRMSRQALPIVPGGGFVPGVSVPSSNFGDLDVGTTGLRYYPFISSRAGFALHSEFSILRQRGVAPVTGLDVRTSSLLFGFDFAF